MQGGASKHMGHANIQGVSKHKGGIQAYGWCPNMGGLQTYRGCPNIWGHSNMQGASHILGHAFYVLCMYRGHPNITQTYSRVFKHGCIQTYGAV